MKDIIHYLCSDECAGRMTGTDGERLAANHIANVYKKIGLPGINSQESPSAYHLGWAFDGKFKMDYFLTRAIPIPSHWWNTGWESADKVTSYNLGAILPGTDPKLKNEYIAISAHYDHLGKSAEGIFRGADDNASGTAAVAELAQCLKDYKPKRSLIFLHFSGEEQGLLGSEAFLKNSPVPATSIKGNINLDMVGRNADGLLQVGPAKTRSKVFTLTRDARQIAPKHGITLREGIDNYLDQSDHYSFLEKKIPIVYFHTGMHDDYHKVTDTPEKLNYNKLAQIVKIVRDLVVKAADDPAAPSAVHKSEWSKWDWPKEKALMAEKEN